MTAEIVVSAHPMSAKTATADVRLEPPSMHRAAEFVAAVARSRRVHGRWARPPATHAQYRAYVKRMLEPNQAGHLIVTGSGELAGVVNISEIVRGAFCSGYLGYYAFAPHHGRGYMRAGLAAVIRRAFGDYGLHRLEANIQPGNRRSIELAKGLGFVLEGYSRRYLKIAGRWRDHERWALTVETWKELRARSPSGRRGARQPSASA